MTTLHATNTHLYRGARLECPAPFPAEPGAVRIVFRDGGEVEAALHPGEQDGELVLAVDAHRTEAGQAIAAKHWRIARIEADAAGETAVVGTRIR